MLLLLGSGPPGAIASRARDSYLQSLHVGCWAGRDPTSLAMFAPTKLLLYNPAAKTT